VFFVSHAVATRRAPVVPRGGLRTGDAARERLKTQAGPSPREMTHPALRVRPAGSFLQGDLPTGCALCEAGAKMVLFVTGVCHYKCFYCPISDEKRMARATWANERRVDHAWSTRKDADASGRLTDDLFFIAEEARAIGAKGTGITGGDPMYAPELTLRYIRFLKAEFGPRHHIHMYTQIPFDAKWLRELAEAGLDEMRFHPPDEIWPDVDAHPRYADLYRAAKRLEDEGLWAVGFEIPCLPGSTEQMSALVAWLVKERIAFLNVNEMEFSETNYGQLLQRGYRILDDVTMRVRDSEAVAREVMARFAARPISLHFCSSPFKDAIQLRQRLQRRAQRVARPHERVTEDGTLLRGIVECPDPAALSHELRAAFGLAEQQMFVDEAGKRLEVDADALERFAGDLPYAAYVSELYPTHDALEVEREPLNRVLYRKQMTVEGGRVVMLEEPVVSVDRRIGRPGGL